MKKSARILPLAALAAVMLLVSSCGSKKNLVNDSSAKASVDAQTSATPQPHVLPAPKEATDVKKVNFIQRVADNALTSAAISSKIKFNIQTGSKDITVPGTLRMKRDEVIRIHLQIPFLGSEAGRLEFTPDYVLILDRLHKEYVKADYNQVEFLKRNGLTFHSLQALFWNQLFMPGKEQLSAADMQQYEVNLQSSPSPITLQKGKMTYTWLTNSQAQIERTSVLYAGGKDGDTKVDVSYADFLTLGAKPFPAQIGIAMTTTAIKGKNKDMKLNITLNNPSTDGNWETLTEVSKKFTQVSVDDAIGNIMSLTK
jgi:hypothetical protein